MEQKTAHKLIALILLAFGILLGVSVRADCTLAPLNTELNYYGYVVNFGEAIKARAEEKGFEVVTADADHSYEFDFKAENRPDRRFDHSVIQFWVKDMLTGKMVFATEQTRTCIMQLCTVQDFAHTIVKALKVMEKELPKCEKPGTNSF